MKAFLTGSQIYGTPRLADDPDGRSDVDLVVLMDEDEMKQLAMFRDNDDPGGGSDAPRSEGATLKFGILNLIIETNEDKYSLWKLGTEQLTDRRVASGKPIKREEAVEHFEKLFARLER